MLNEVSALELHSDHDVGPGPVAGGDRVHPRAAWRFPIRFLFGCLVLAALPASVIQAAETNAPARPARGYSYLHDQVAEAPWSIHIFKIDRSHPDLAFATTLGSGGSIGLGTITQQLKQIPATAGKPVAAVNGDFYDTGREYMGRPRDLQIQFGELVTSPSGHAVFWMDLTGSPRFTNLTSHFRIVWPDGGVTPFALNGPRGGDEAVLYTSRMGTSTHTSGGTELVLEETSGKPGRPMQIGRTNVTLVKEVRAAGDTSIDPGFLVLSLGPKLAARITVPTNGHTLTFITETTPDLAGVETAIGGGPTLVRQGKPAQWGGIQLRHPRTAIGWNREFIFLVEVDGRQNGLSIGMTLPELAAYMAKLGCDEAMNLDGGGSATFWACGNVMNSPSEGHERPVANALVVLDRNPAQAQVRR